MANKFFKFPSSIKARLQEMTISSPLSGLRSSLSALRSGFWQSPTSPALRDTKIDKDKARELYYNTNARLNQGAFLARPIVNGVADFIDIPFATVGDELLDDLINNDWLGKTWKRPLWEAFRNSLREADTWIRIRKPFPEVFLGPDSQEQVELEIIDSDRVTPYYDPATNRLIRVEVLHTIYIEDQPFDPSLLYTTGLRSHGREHQVIEILTPFQYFYYDSTEGRFLEEFTVDNEWGFIGMVQMFNDFDTALNGGISELEVVYPFFQALHDLVDQTRSAHKYHANPKVKFKLEDVSTFLKNNFPNSFVNGEFTGKVSWRDIDVFFLEQNDDAGFVEAQMNTADSVTLMEFIIDCICMAAELPESVVFRTRAESAIGNDEFERYKKKVARKRTGFEPYIQTLVMMALYVTKGSSARPFLSWPTVQAQDLIDMATAMNNIVTASEVANRAQVISRNTYRARIRQFFPGMKDSQIEDSQIKKEVQQESQQQIDQQKQLALIGINTPTNGNGPNGANRQRVQTDVAPPPASG